MIFEAISICDSLDNILFTNVMNIMVEFDCLKIIHLLNDNFILFFRGLLLC